MAALMAFVHQVPYAIDNGISRIAARRLWSNRTCRLAGQFFSDGSATGSATPNIRPPWLCLHGGGHYHPAADPDGGDAPSVFRVFGSATAAWGRCCRSSPRTASAARASAHLRMLTFFVVASRLTGPLVGDGSTTPPAPIVPHGGSTCLAGCRNRRHCIDEAPSCECLTMLATACKNRLLIERSLGIVHVNPGQPPL